MPTFHIKINIADALTWSDRKLDGLLCDAETKRDLTPNEIKCFLRKEAKNGRLYFTGCDNTDAEGSCIGHPSKKETEGADYPYTIVQGIKVDKAAEIQKVDGAGHRSAYGKKRLDR